MSENEINGMGDMLDVSNLTDTPDIEESTSNEDSTLEAPPTEALEPTPSIDELNQTIASLREELEAYKAEAARKKAIATQINEFSELFPEIQVRSIPDEVWEDVKRGNTLAAAYSVYERRITEAARRIESINIKNAERSAGSAGKGTTQEFFSADEVRKMSPSEVRANYAKIRKSMEKWN